MAELDWKEIRLKIMGLAGRYNFTEETGKDGRRAVDKELETFLTSNNLTEIKRRYWKDYYYRYTGRLNTR